LYTQFQINNKNLIKGKQHTGHAFHAPHDVVRDQVSRELRLLELRICDDESQLQRRFRDPHPTSSKRGDIAIMGSTCSSSPLLTVYYLYARPHSPQFIVDVKLASMITGTTHAIKTIVTALEASERSKETKHCPLYSPIGFTSSFLRLPFVASCFGCLASGLAAIWFLAALPSWLIWNWNDTISG
jgi:hypothetical protein